MPTIRTPVRPIEYGVPGGGWLYVPRFRFALELWHRPPDQPDGRFGGPYPFLFDTGADTCLIGEPLARQLGFTLADDFRHPLRVATGVVSSGWMIRRFVRFPSLPDLRFKFYLMVAEGADVDPPILGVADLLANFTVGLWADECVLGLRDDHLGEPIDPLTGRPLAGE